MVCTEEDELFGCDVLDKAEAHMFPIIKKMN